MTTAHDHLRRLTRFNEAAEMGAPFPSMIAVFRRRLTRFNEAAEMSLLYLIQFSRVFQRLCDR